ncbi:hypothetical protein PtA15_11A344 [Puccinia triticina]|uniref:Uncharacterized protein n=1 Tax=Puccinia triticina TaxID=208348 RepID=A0ABY7CWH9_9BASI|nr:uncharacterized protein PtA15_11A344 [Puccinia triticina]WAQ89654.1 hypothetical protein PtA15_11A344 [Puccinia triticina]
MDVEPSNISSSPLGSASELPAPAPSSSRSKARGSKARMMTVGGNRFEAPSHSIRHKADSFRSSGSRRGNPTATEWLSNSFDDNQMSPRSATKIVDKELASQYNDFGDPFLDADSSNSNMSPLNNTSTAETIPGTATSSEPQTSYTPETAIVAENDPSTAIASPPGSPIAS